MTAIYNEIEAYPAAWMRNLIAAGHIAPGTVDERSIVDLGPEDVRGATQAHFFAGIGVWSHALRLAGWPDDRPAWTGSCPCQPFSAAGRGLGTADARHLWPEWFRLIRQCRPPVVFGEQVASPAGLGWFDAVRADLEGAGYAVGVSDLCAASVGAPHIRQRLYFVAYADGSAGGLLLRPRQARQEVTQAERCCEAGELADLCGTGLEVGSEQPTRRELETAERGREAGELGNSRGARGRRHAGAVPGAQGEGSSERRGAGRVADLAGAASAARGMADTYEPDGVDGREQGGRGLVQSAPYPTSGFWSDADWIACRDGKARPVEPGTFPLAHGVAGRVGKLRAYGNAICAPLAAAFISSAMECLP